MLYHLDREALLEKAFNGHRRRSDDTMIALARTFLMDGQVNSVRAGLIMAAAVSPRRTISDDEIDRLQGLMLHRAERDRERLLGSWADPWSD